MSLTDELLRTVIEHTKLVLQFLYIEHSTAICIHYTQEKGQSITTTCDGILLYNLLQHSLASPKAVSRKCKIPNTDNHIHYIRIIEIRTFTVLQVSLENNAKLLM